MRVEDQDGARAHVLVVERDHIVGYGLTEDLADFGYRVTGPLQRLPDVIALLGSDPPDAAIIDIGLADGAGLVMARALRAQGARVVFFSAGDRRSVAGEFKDVPWVDKPAPTERLLGALKLPVRFGASP